MFAEHLAEWLYHMVRAQSISHGKIFKNILAVLILNVLLWGKREGCELVVKVKKFKLSLYNSWGRCKGDSNIRWVF